ncbi:VOC family protein [Novosphingobium panipatense]
MFFFVKPESTGGVLLEVCELPMPNDPWDRGNWNPAVSAGHHATVKGLDHIACVTKDIDAAIRFFTEVIDGHLLEDARTTLPQAGRRVLLQVGDTRVAFTQPDEVREGRWRPFSIRSRMASTRSCGRSRTRTRRAATSRRSCPCA